MVKRLLDGSVKSLLLSVLLSGWISLPAQAQDKSTEAWQRLSRLQCLVEYFYMETGVYPLDLAEMDQAFKQRKPAEVKSVAIPLDPATNQPFTYKLEGRRYVLSVPDPGKYGGERIAVSSVDWGYLSDLADLRRFAEIVRQMQGMLKLVATQLEMYAKDHGGQYPESLDELLPKYFTRVPSDPLTGKNLSYKKQVSGYTVGCPNPEKYGFKIFQYQSAQGMQMERARREGATKPAASPKDDNNR